MVSNNNRSPSKRRIKPSVVMAVIAIVVAWMVIVLQAVRFVEQSLP